MKKASYNQIVRFAITVATVCGIVVVYFKWLPVNPTTVGFTFLLAILMVSAGSGTSLRGFHGDCRGPRVQLFFPSTYSPFHDCDSQNWVALFAFLLTAIIASELSERARHESLESNQRRREVERLYAFSQQLLVSENVFELLNLIPKHIVDSFGVTSAAMFLEAKQETYYLDNNSRPLFSTEQLKAICGRGEPVLDRERGFCFMPLRMGVRSVGSIGLAGCELSRETLEAIGSLTAIAIERAGTVDQLTKSEAARESDRLRSVLLDSVTHEFRTPLTSIKASAETLLSDVDLDKPLRKDLLTVINEESDRLNRLIGEAAEVAQLDSHQLELDFHLHEMREAIDAAIDKSAPALQGHPLQSTIPNKLPMIRMDVDRITEVLVHLLQNAGQIFPGRHTDSDHG